MSKILHTLSRKISSLVVLSVLALAGFSIPAFAGYDDNRGPWHYASDDGPRCRPVLKKFRIGSTIFNEKGTACRDRYGNWDMTQRTRFPQYRGEIYMMNRGRYTFVGYLEPTVFTRKSLKDRHDHDDDDCDDRDHDHDRHDHRRDYYDYGWNDKKSYKRY